MRHPLWGLAAAALAALILTGCGSSPAPTNHPSSNASKGQKAQGVTGLIPSAKWTCASNAPPGPGGTGIIVSTAQTMGSVTWYAAAQQQKGCVVVYRSSGSNWQRASVVLASGDGVSAVDMLFVNPHDGWVLAPGFPGAGQVPWALYHTTDGGTTWTSQPVKKGSPFPTSNMNLEMAFTSPSDGWLSGLNGFYYPPKVFLYHTTDGGASWTVTSFAVPTKDGPNLQYANPPVFTDRLHGTMTVTGRVSGSPSTTLTYTTQNSGVTWTLLGGQ